LPYPKEKKEKEKKRRSLYLPFLILSTSRSYIFEKTMTFVGANNIADKLVSVRGTVVKVSTVRPLVRQMSFDCAKCKTEITRIFPDGKFSPPASCSFNGCKSKFFNPIRSTAQTTDFQRVR
jgi:DNA replicative helicase MCM subunit Mcm2 (Cdc46/Mcm family)